MFTNHTLSWIGILSATVTGVLAILGFFTNYRSRETNKLTIWGKIGATLIVLTTFLGVLTKFIEFRNQQNEMIEVAEKARKAAEESLVILQGISRTVNIISNIDIDTKMSYLFDDINMHPTALRSLENNPNDSSISTSRLRNMLSNSAIERLSNFAYSIYIVPISSISNNCLENIIPERVVSFGASPLLSNLEIPQLSKEFQADWRQHRMRRRSRSEVLSLVDFNNAAVIFVVDEPVAESNQDPSPVSRPAAPSPPTHGWQADAMTFSFDGGRTLRVNRFETRRDQCTGLPYSIARTQPDG